MKLFSLVDEGKDGKWQCPACGGSGYNSIPIIHTANGCMYNSDDCSECFGAGYVEYKPEYKPENKLENNGIKRYH